MVFVCHRRLETSCGHERGVEQRGHVPWEGMRSKGLPCRNRSAMHLMWAFILQLPRMQFTHLSFSGEADETFKDEDEDDEEDEESVIGKSPQTAHVPFFVLLEDMIRFSCSVLSPSKSSSSSSSTSLISISSSSSSSSASPSSPAAGSSEAEGPDLRDRRPRPRPGVLKNSSRGRMWVVT